VFSSVGVLVETIETWAEHGNDDPKPFLWHTPAQEIIAKVRRGRTTSPEPNPRRITSDLGDVGAARQPRRHAVDDEPLPTSPRRTITSSMMP
jgi:hypothetical protein